MDVAALEAAIEADRAAGVFTTELAGRTCLRICAIRPEAKEEGMRGTVRRLNACCEEVMARLRG